MKVSRFDLFKRMPSSNGMAILITIFVSCPAYARIHPSSAINPSEVGSCYLDEDPSTHPVAKKHCLIAQAEIDATWTNRTLRSRSLLQSMEMYYGFHPAPGHALHFRAQEIFSSSLLLSRAFPQLSHKYFDNSIPLAIYQFGNHSKLDRFTFEIGKKNLPFGIFQTPLKGFYLLEDPVDFWNTPNLGAQLSYDNFADSVVEVGVATQNQSYFVKSKSAEDTMHAASVRVMFDFSALTGTRLVFSLLADSKQEKRVGFGLLHLGKDGSLFQTEWVRLLNPKIIDLFSQLFRISYETSNQKKSKTIYLYDDVRNEYRIFTIAQEMVFYPHLNSRFALSYKKDETKTQPNAVYFILGCGIKL